MLEERRETLQKTIEFLQNRMTIQPKIAIVLGSGLGGLTKEIEILDEIPYGEIPNFPVSTVKGHKGTLIFGRLNQVEVVVLNGRFHYYEGYDFDTVAFYVRVMHLLGVDVVYDKCPELGHAFAADVGLYPEADAACQRAIDFLKAEIGA